MRSKTLALSSTFMLLLGVACGGGGGGSSSPSAPPPANTVVVVDMEDFEFVPKQVQIDPGTTVRWVRRGVDPNHTTKSKVQRWNSGLIFDSEGDVFEHTFTAADEGLTFEYLCATHTDTHGMKGSVRVGANAPDADPGY